MCRSIKTLRTEDSLVDADMRAAAPKYVRKVSGYRQPSKANAAAFEQAWRRLRPFTDRLLAVVRPGHA